VLGLLAPSLPLLIIASLAFPDLPDRDDDDEDGGDRMGTGRILFGSAAFSPCACFFVCFFSLFAS